MNIKWLIIKNIEIYFIWIKLLLYLLNLFINNNLLIETLL